MTPEIKATQRKIVLAPPNWNGTSPLRSAILLPDNFEDYTLDDLRTMYSNNKIPSIALISPDGKIIPDAEECIKIGYHDTDQVEKDILLLLQEKV